jgi:hypothetical protein
MIACMQPAPNADIIIAGAGTRASANPLRQQILKACSVWLPRPTGTLARDRRTDSAIRPRVASAAAASPDRWRAGGPSAEVLT